MVQAAIMKIRDEMAENTANASIQRIGDYLLQQLQSSPDAAQQILAEGKTLRGSLAAMAKEAQKQKVGNCAVLTDEEGFALVRQYFGMTDKRTGFSLSLDDLLRG